MMRRWRHLLLLLVSCLFSLLIMPSFVMAKNDKKTIHIGQLTGVIDDNNYGYDYLSELVKYTDWKLEFVKDSMPNLIEKLNKGEIDIIDSLHYTKERDEFLDFSKLSYGSDIGCLYVPLDSKLLYDDYNNFSSLKIGMVRGFNCNVNFNNYAKKNKFHYNAIYFDNLEELYKAYDNGIVNGVVDENSRSKASSKIVARFGYEPLYLAVKEGNSLLLEEIDEAMEELNIQKPMVLNNLFSKYHIENINNATVFTLEENEYVKKNKILKIAFRSDWYPMEYYNEKSGEYEGFIVDMMREIFESIDVELEIVDSKNYNQNMSMLYNGDIDLMASEIDGQKIFPSDAAYLTDMYLKIPMVIVGTESSINKNGAIEVGLLEHNDAVINYINKYYNSSSYSYYDSAKEALQGIIDGKIDIVLANSYEINEVIFDDVYKLLKIVDVDELSTKLSIAVSKKQDPILVSIINKTIANISNDRKTSVILRSSTMSKDSVTFSEFVSGHKMEIIIIFLILGLVYVFITLRINKKMNIRLEDLAYRDVLTGCYNRVKFEQDAKRLLGEGDSSYSLVFIDVDDFKLINEMYGRLMSDNILKYIANNLHTCDIKGYISARVNADHFVALIPNISENIVEDFVESQLHLLQNYHISDAENLILTFSCGIYHIYNTEEEIDKMIDKAIIASRTIKGNHLEFSAVYKDSMMDKVKRDAEIVQIMDKALEDEEFKVFLQPKYNLKSNKMVGAEALVRWYSKKKGLMPPDAFIPLFEKNGFIVKMDFYILECVCAMMAKWSEEGKEPIVVSVNQSRRDLECPNYIERLVELRKKYGILQNAIELEITESAFLDYPEYIINRMTEIKEAGFLVSIDDFGSGYSSLNLLRNVPADIIKIDKNFLDESIDSDRTKSIIKHVVDMSKELNMDVICEGVETKQQAEFLNEINCTMVQGYLYARPMPCDDFTNLLKLNE